MAGQASYYWDSCVFLAWLKDEQDRPAGEMDGAREVIQRMMRNEIVMATSTLTLTEVAHAKIDAAGIKQFDALMRRRNFQRISVDIKIATLARELRDYYSARRPDSKTLSAPDAIHLATAIRWGVAEFHTFDGRDNNHSLGLLPLDGSPGGHPLRICKPSVRQPGLDLRPAASSPAPEEGANDEEEAADDVSAAANDSELEGADELPAIAASTSQPDAVQMDGSAAASAVAVADKGEDSEPPG